MTAHALFAFTRRAATYRTRLTGTAQMLRRQLAEF